jgi:hypothetical protein
MARQPFSQWTDVDHSGPLVIVTVLCLVYWIVPGAGQQLAALSRDDRLSLSDHLFISTMVNGSRLLASSVC